MKPLLLAIALSLSFSSPSFAGRNISTRIDGTDTLCSSYTPSVSGATQVLTCVSAGAGSPTNCHATVNNSLAATLPSTGGSANLAVTCDQTAGVTYNWSKNGTPGANTNRTWTDTLASNPSSTTAVNYTYQVTACIGAACATSPSSPLTMSVLASGSFNGSCPGFSGTQVITMNWASPTRMFSSNFTPTSMVIVQFTTGSGMNSANNLPKIGGAEYVSTPSARYAVLSATPCDFSPQATYGASSSGYSVTVPFAVGGGNNFGYYPQLLNNTTYYFNVKNLDGAACSANGVCDMFFDLSKAGLP